MEMNCETGTKGETGGNGDNPLSLTTLRANQDAPRHIGTVTPAAPDLLLNTLGGDSAKRRRVRDILYRFLHR